MTERNLEAIDRTPILDEDLPGYLERQPLELLRRTWVASIASVLETEDYTLGQVVRAMLVVRTRLCATDFDREPDKAAKFRANNPGYGKRQRAKLKERLAADPVYRAEYEARMKEYRARRLEKLKAQRAYA